MGITVGARYIIDGSVILDLIRLEGTYPFVRLAGSRATCHICLEEFQEPKKKSIEFANRDKEVPAKKEATFEAADDNLSTGIKWIQRFKSKKSILEDPLKLEAAGDGAQPLRLLACGHVFHVGPLVYHG